VTPRDRNWPGSDGIWLGVTGSGCRRSIRQFLGTFQLLRGCNLQEVAVTWQEMTSREPTWPEVTSFDRKSIGSGCRRRIRQILGTLELLQGCNSQEVAITWQKMTSRDPTWPEVTWKWRHLTGSPGSGCRRRISGFEYVWAPTGLYLTGSDSHVTGNDLR